MKRVNNYQLNKLLGSGGFGEVYLAKKENSPELYAIKSIPLTKKTYEELSKYIKTEIDIMKEIKHENVIKLYEYFQTSHNFYMVMEYCNGGDLTELLKDYKLKYGKPFSIPIIQHFMRQILKALKLLHSRNIIHRDIKLENLMAVFKNQSDKDNFNYLNAQIKIIDFGLSAKLEKGVLAKTFVGCLYNMDPMILNKYKNAGGYHKLQTYNEKADIWSLGTVFYEMYTGDSLFADFSNIGELIQKVEEGNYRLPLNYDLSNEVLSFLNSMLQYNPDARSSAEQLLKHDFIVKDVKDFTPVNLEAISYKVREGELVINFKENATIWKVFNLKEKNDYEGVRMSINILNRNQIEEAEIFKESQLKDSCLHTQNKIQQYVNGLLNEYSSAKLYFEKYMRFNQLADANFKINEINKAKSLIEASSPIDLNTLPKPITPEYIYGCSKAERDQKFIILINYYKKEKESLEEKINNYKKDNTALYINQELERINKQLNNINSLLEKLDKRYKNEWVPGPDFISETYKIPIRNIIPGNLQLKVLSKIINKVKDNLSIEMILKIDNNKNLKQLVEINQNNKYQYEFMWNINSNDLKNVINNENNFLLIIKNKVTNSELKIHITQTLLGKDKSFNIKYPSGNNEYVILHNIIKPTSAQKKIELTFQDKESLVIKTLYPAFMGKSIFTGEIPKFK